MSYYIPGYDVSMIETHPFGSFVPQQARYLILGSFTTKEAYNGQQEKYVWFYSNGGRNNFWPILEAVYGVELKTRKQMEELLTALEIVLADIIYQCERTKSSNLDVNLTNIVYAIDDVTRILTTNPIKKIFFTSRFVEGRFRRVFKTLINEHPEIELITLPSPSPRYVLMTKEQKIKCYKDAMPKLLRRL